MINSATKVLSFMRQYQREKKYPPTQYEIAQATGLSHVTVSDRIRWLARQQIIVHIPRRPRGAYLANEPHPFQA